GDRRVGQQAADGDGAGLAGGDSSGDTHAQSGERAGADADDDEFGPGFRGEDAGQCGSDELDVSAPVSGGFGGEDLAGVRVHQGHGRRVRGVDAENDHGPSPPVVMPSTAAIAACTCGSLSSQAVPSPVRSTMRRSSSPSSVSSAGSPST